MNRRRFLAFLATVPVLGRLVPKSEPLREAFAKMEWTPPLSGPPALTDDEISELVKMTIDGMATVDRATMLRDLRDWEDGCHA